MSDDLERLLGESFDAQARGAVPDGTAPPSPRFAQRPGRAQLHRRRPPARVLAPLAAAAAVLAVGGSVVALQDRTPAAPPAGATHRAAPSSTARPPVRPVPVQRGSGAPVRIEFGTAGGVQYGVGMPVIAYFSRQFTSARELSAATSVTVDGKPVRAAWFFARSTARRGFPVEGHLRLRGYWPAHARVEVALAADGITAGRGLVFTNSPQLRFTTGARIVAVVDARAHRLTVTRDGTALGSFPVSLGSSRTPTSRGVKVIMSKQPSVCLHDVNGTFKQCGVKFAQRLTDSGEYLLAAPWNVGHITAGIDSSSGSVDLRSADAKSLYADLEVGDVVDFPNADGPAMHLDDGLGDWNVPWPTWVAGGLIPTNR